MAKLPLSRIAVVALAAVGATTVAFASAATLGGLQASFLGAGGAGIPRCDSAVVATPATFAGNVVSVTVGDVADACEGGELTLKLTDGAGTVIAAGGPTAVPVDGDSLPTSVLVTVSPNPPAEQAATAKVSIVGP